MSPTLAAPALFGGTYLVLARQWAPGQWEWGLLLAALIGVLVWQSPIWRTIIVFFALGFLSCHFYIGHYADHRLSPELAGREFEIAGVIRGGIHARKYGYSFTLEIDHWRALSGPDGRAPPRLRVHWYQTETAPGTGEHIRALVRVRPPRTKHSGAGFDEENYALVHRLYGSAYIRRLLEHDRGAPADWRARIDRWRFALSERIASLPGSENARAIVNGLANGDRRAISDSLWQLLNRTGTSHLMAISGLHIGLFSLCVWRLLMAVMILAPGVWPLSRHWLLVGGTIAVTSIYALLCGMSLPTQRALVMLVAFLLAQLCARTRSSTRALLVAFIVVVLWQPAAIVSAGLWLSFCAVACLLLSHAAVAHKPVWYRWLYIQANISLFLLPVCIYWFGQSALTANLANLPAIPLVCFAILPLVWAAVVADMLLPALGQWLFARAFELTDLLTAILEIAVALPKSYMVFVQPGVAALLLAWLGLALIFLAPIRSVRLAGIILCLPLLTGRNDDTPGRAQAHLSMIDVGQGLALAIQTQQHTMLYDTGPQYGSSGSAGGRIIAPWLERRGLTRLNRVLVSHFDKDHSGGLIDLVGRIPVDAIINNDIPVFTRHLNASLVRQPRQSLCQAGQSWNWNGVRFEVLWPTATASARTRNNRSCVLWLRTPHLSALIPGDIDSGIEAKLIELYPELRADVLVVAHHGSRFSTHSALLEHIRPRLALISAGYLNRWRMPAAEVLQRLREAGVPWLSTAQQGTITVRLESGRIRITTQTGQRRRYWYRASLPEPVPCQPPIVYQQCMKLSQPAAGSRGLAPPVQ